MKIPENYHFSSLLNSFKKKAYLKLQKRLKSSFFGLSIKKLPSKKKQLFIAVGFSIFALIGIIIYTGSLKNDMNASEKKVLSRVVKNYKKNIDVLATQFNLPPSYLLAVIALESSGRKKVPVRYEKAIFTKLLQLKNAEIKQFENLKTKDVKKLSNVQLKALASSYGPFQIMGYKCYILNISLSTLKGKNHLFYAIKWINLTYGG
ncbi:MAG: hypothetical protein P1P88_25695, partial [Bacteroidales bacterium]|nr:hypothetical protein [Bacteroidales bacterium]